VESEMHFFLAFIVLPVIITVSSLHLEE